MVKFFGINEENPRNMLINIGYELMVLLTKMFDL